VGPRPERPEFVAGFEKNIPAYAERKKVLPGITGLAQISGLYASDPEMKLKYDLLYIYNYRPLMDPAIAYRTLQLVARQVLSAGDIP
jgi:lipopolysaccharide/colanic/teichoic acid biosynthesis glycosyltransferase